MLSTRTDPPIPSPHLTSPHLRNQTLTNQPIILAHQNVPKTWHEEYSSTELQVLLEYPCVWPPNTNSTKQTGTKMLSNSRAWGTPTSRHIPGLLLSRIKSETNGPGSLSLTAFCQLSLSYLGMVNRVTCYHCLQRLISEDQQEALPKDLEDKLEL